VRISDRCAIAIALLVTVLSTPASAGHISAEPFAKSCLTGRYVMATTAWDVTINYPPGTPWAMTGYVNTVCTGVNSGTYTGQIDATYPGVTPPPVCAITEGTYTINPVTGGLTSAATLADVTDGSCAAFGPKSISESGFLSDPKAKQFYQVETGQDGGDTISYIWTKE
jgi:hypothetical protein